MAASTTDKIFHAKVYLEPDLYTIVQRVADKDRESLSPWLRKLILKELIARGEVPQDILIKLASG
jgi:hypothetical protein